MATYDTSEAETELRDSPKKTFNKPSYLRRIEDVFSGKNRKKEKAKNAILSHPGVRDLFQYYSGENLSTSNHSMSEETKKENEPNVEEIINDMLNLIKDNYKDYTYSEYKDKRFSYSKFEKLFKQKF